VSALIRIDSGLFNGRKLPNCEWNISSDSLLGLRDPRVRDTLISKGNGFILMIDKPISPQDEFARRNRPGQVKHLIHHVSSILTEIFKHVLFRRHRVCRGEVQAIGFYDSKHVDPLMRESEIGEGSQHVGDVHVDLSDTSKGEQLRPRSFRNKYINSSIT
jgi:hypothetical protein